MATNPNKPWSIAYWVWERNQAKKLQQPQQPLQPAWSTQVVSWWPQVTANAIWWGTTSVQAPKPITPKVPQILQRKPATVATPQNPVISKNIGWGFVPNTSDIDNMDRAWLQNFIDTYSVKAKFGTIKEEDAIKAVKAQRMLNEMINKEATTNVANPYQDIIAQQEQARAQKEQQLMSQAETWRAAKQRELDAKYRAMQEQQIAAWQRQREAAQLATSTTWFGRSTFNADQQVQIQKETDNAVAQLNAAKEAELIKYEMELQWATWEALASLDQNIAELKQKAMDAQVKALNEAQRINLETGKSTQESVQNLIAVAQGSGLDIKASDEWAITMLAQIVKGKDGKLNQDVLNQLPDGIRQIVAAAAQTWYGTKQWEAAKTISIWSGKSERVLQRNPETWRYDIPVGGWFAWGGVGWSWGGRWGSGGWAWVWTADSTQLELISRLQRVQDAVSNSKLPRSSAMLDPNIQADLAYLKANMTFEKLNEMKARWVKLWVLSDSDMKLLWQAALTITPGMTKTRVLEETNRLIQGLWGNTAPAPKQQQNTPAQQPKTGWTSAGKAKALSLMK